MKNWRYLYFSAAEKQGSTRNRSAAFPWPHLLSITFQKAQSVPVQKQDELQFIFSTGTVKVRGDDLRGLATKLCDQSADPAGDPRITITGDVTIEWPSDTA